MDAKWATYPLTRRSIGDRFILTAGGEAAWKAQLLPTVTMSTTEAKYTEAAVMGQLTLFCCSVIWDLGVPQCAATIGYEDNDA